MLRRFDDFRMIKSEICHQLVQLAGNLMQAVANNGRGFDLVRAFVQRREQFLQCGFQQIYIAYLLPADCRNAAVGCGCFRDIHRHALDHRRRFTGQLLVVMYFAHHHIH